MHDGRVFCWGANEFGQLGDGSRFNRAEPSVVDWLDHTPSMLSAGTAHTCALTESGEVYCWGNNEHGQVGNGTGLSFRPLTWVHSLGADAVSVEAGPHHSCAILSSGGVQCWGLLEGSRTRSRWPPEWVVIERP
jgi:alpha-tubulin suppressor-like RCC1 family protein